MFSFPYFLYFREVVPMEESVFHRVALFSVHSVISAVGFEQVRTRIKTLSDMCVSTRGGKEGGDGEGDVILMCGEMKGADEEGDTEGGEDVESENKIKGEEGTERMNIENEETGGGQEGGEGGGGLGGEEVNTSNQHIDKTGHDNGDEEEGAEDDENVTISKALECYDNGRTFQGTFSESKANINVNQNISTLMKEKTEIQFRKSIQLLSQLCITEPLLLKALFSIYGAAASANRDIVSADLGPKDGISENEKNELKIIEVSPAGVIPNPIINEDKKEMIIKIENKYTIICDIIEAELMSIIPAISKRKECSLMFTILLGKDSDPLIRPLLEISLESMLADYSIPANREIIITVKNYINSNLFLRSIDEKNEKIICHENGSGNENQNETDKIIFEDKKRTATLRILFPLLGGFESQELIDILPNLLLSFGDQPEVLKSAFKRMFSARPPPLSKAALFAALHRYEV